jgi:RNA polymerase sigma factor (sigma-70 family)
MSPSFIESLHKRPVPSSQEELDTTRRIRDLRIAFWTSAMRSRDAKKVLAHVRETVVQQGAAGSVIKAIDGGVRPKDIVAELLNSGIDPGLVRSKVRDARTLSHLANYQRERARFVERNMRLVVKVAFQSPKILSIEDRIQEGNVGLLRAVDTFDPERGYRFSTYAVWWIRHRIYRATTNNRGVVRIPQHIVTAHLRVQKVKPELRKKLGHEPTSLDIEQVTGIPVAVIEKVSQVMNLRLCSYDVLVESNEAPCDETLLEIEVDPMSILDRALDELQPRLRGILVQRFGLRGKKALTLREIGDTHGLSRERIRQLQQKAIRNVQKTLLLDSR